MVQNEEDNNNNKLQTIESDSGCLDDNSDANTNDYSDIVKMRNILCYKKKHIN